MIEGHANGKLLLTGEYAVLDGAQALAVPTQLGQSMSVRPIAGASQQLWWKSFSSDGKKWLDARIQLNDFNKSHFSVGDPEVLARLHQLLTAGQDLRPGLFDKISSHSVSFQLEFPRDYGLGSSSTLLHLLGCWWGLDAFELLEKTFGGSGYDLACAATDLPILYWKGVDQKPQWQEQQDWQPNWLNDTFFVHLNQKQNSREGIKRYRSKTKTPAFLKAISKLTQQLLKAESITAASSILDEHEQRISRIIELPTVKKRLFSNYQGSIKSLGAWGGDFVWVLPGADSTNPTQYFRKKGYTTIFSWADMVR